MKETVTFRSGGQNVRAALITPEGVRPTGAGVVYFHGCGSSRSRYEGIAERLSQAGLVGLAVDLRGHGESEGSLKVLGHDDVVNDGLNAYDFLKGRGIAERVGLCGASLGGLVSVMVSSERAVESMVLRAPATYSAEMRRMNFADILATQNGLFFEILDVQQTTGAYAITAYTGDLSVVVSENDEVIPRSIPRMFLNSADKARSWELVVMRGVSHAISGEASEFFAAHVDRRFRATLA